MKLGMTRKSVSLDWIIPCERVAFENNTLPIYLGMWHFRGWWLASMFHYTQGADGDQKWGGYLLITKTVPERGAPHCLSCHILSHGLILAPRRSDDRWGVLFGPAGSTGTDSADYSGATLILVVINYRSGKSIPKRTKRWKWARDATMCLWFERTWKDQWNPSPDEFYLRILRA